MESSKSEVSQSTFTNYQKWVIALLGIAQFTVILDFMIMSPIGDILIKSFHISPKQFGWVVSSYAFSAGISGILAAGFADNYDRKKILVFFYLGFMAGTLFCALASTYELLLIARIVTGLFGGVISSISMAIVADIFSANQRGRALGFIQLGFSVSQILGIPIGIYFANLWGWHSSFLMIVVLSTITTLLIKFKMLPIADHLKVKKESNVYQHFKFVVTQKQYLIGFAATAFLSIGGFLLMPFASSYAVNNLKVSTHDLPFLFMITGIVSIVAMPIIGSLADKFDKFNFFFLASIWSIIFAIIYNTQGPIPFWLVSTLNVLFFIGILARNTTSSALTASIPNPEDRGAFNSINSSLQQTAGGIASVFAGMIVVQKNSFAPLEHYDTLAYITAATMIICVYLMYLVSKKIKQ